MATNSTTPLKGWTNSPNGRGTIDILTSSLTTLFFCTWSVLCLNVNQFSWRKQAWQKTLMAGLSFIGPEFTFQLAIGQYYSARRSVKLFQQTGYSGWTMKHAFFANMGGFELQTQLSPRQRIDWRPFPIDAKQLHYLVHNGYVPYSTVRVENHVIADRDKVDGLLRAIIVCQIIWYFVCCVGRWCQHLTVTVLELATLGFIFCTLGTYYFWFDKPADVGNPITIRPNATMEEILVEAGECAREPYKQTPMDFVGRDIWSWPLYWTYWMGIARKLGVRFHSAERPINKIPDDNFPSISPLGMLLMFVVQSGYGAVHLSGWNLTFPTCAERLLWRISTVTIMMPTRTLGILIGKDEFIELNIHPHRLQSSRKGRFWDILQKLRNNTRPRDPEMDVPLRALLPITALGALYCFPRAYVIIEGFINIRALPPNAYDSVDWTAFIPHF